MSADREHGVRRPGRGPAGRLTGAGALAAVAGSVMYVLPGPGLPLVVTGVSLLLGGAVLWFLGRRRR
ncbi:hypothetical protein ACFFKE_12090 [Streptomyces mutabilis]|uniref:hypothetical protein n=1 Tax=Streptomyces mutabilis TaxID=67332 RepID=UPI001784A679|nr:hypothetical protein [Streptomyces mutabilis]GGQ30687.1 hypothetical protein GCM10010279_43770 [Streptomyces mutabilis]